MADDTKPNAASLALLNAQMDSLAREVGALNPDDPEARRSRQRDLSPDRVGGGDEKSVQ